MRRLALLACLVLSAKFILRVRGKHLFNPAKWDKMTYTPKGKTRINRSTEHIKKFQFKPGERNRGHEVRAAAKAGKK